MVGVGVKLGLAVKLLIKTKTDVRIKCHRTKVPDDRNHHRCKAIKHPSYKT